jgi:hypothetical protein
MDSQVNWGYIWGYIDLGVEKVPPINPDSLWGAGNKADGIDIAVMWFPWRPYAD